MRIKTTYPALQWFMQHLRYHIVTIDQHDGFLEDYNGEPIHIIEILDIEKDYLLTEEEGIGIYNKIIDQTSWSTKT